MMIALQFVYFYIGRTKESLVSKFPLPDEISGIDRRLRGEKVINEDDVSPLPLDGAKVIY